MSTPLETIEQHALEALQRAEKATEGPWAWENTGENSWCLGGVYPPQSGEIIAPFDEETGEFGEKPDVVDFVASGGDLSNLADPDFISYARMDVPTMAAHIFYLTARIRELEGVVPQVPTEDSIFTLAQAMHAEHTYCSYHRARILLEMWIEYGYEGDDLADWGACADRIRALICKTPCLSVGDDHT